MKRKHTKWLRDNRHLRYMWIPHTDAVVVVTNNPLPEDKKAPKDPASYTESEKTAAFQQLLQVRLAACAGLVQLACLWIGMTLPLLQLIGLCSLCCTCRAPCTFSVGKLLGLGRRPFPDLVSIAGGQPGCDARGAISADICAAAGRAAGQGRRAAGQGMGGTRQHSRGGLLAPQLRVEACPGIPYLLSVFGWLLVGNHSSQATYSREGAD